MKRSLTATVLMMAIVLLLARMVYLANTQTGKHAPGFAVTTLDGETFRLSKQRGKVVYLNIWATWCPPCVSEIPAIQRLQDRYGDELVVIGVSVDNNAAEVRSFVKQYGITYAVAMDQGNRLSNELYPTRTIPLSVFISPEGIVTGRHNGSMTYEEMEAMFNRARGGRRGS